MNTCRLSYLKFLESEAIHVIREAVAEFKHPVMLYSVGKDSGVMVHLAQKAFYPGMISFPLMHIDTGYKFPEMYSFRDQFVKSIGAKLIVEKNEEWIDRGCHPLGIGVDRCCGYLKTKALLDAINKHGFDGVFGGGRREEEKSRAKERIFSLRDSLGQWHPRRQRPEPWDLYNTRINEGESMRIFPLSNWTEQDVWEYIRLEEIPVVSIYFAHERDVLRRNNILIPSEALKDGYTGDNGNERVMCRFRSLGCIPCTGAIPSTATTIDEIIEELKKTKKSERENRVIDLTSDSSMEQKKMEGYF